MRKEQSRLTRKVVVTPCTSLIHLPLAVGVCFGLLARCSLSAPAPFVSGSTQHPIAMTSDLPRSSPHLSESSQSFLSLHSQCPLGLKVLSYFHYKDSGSRFLTDQTFGRMVRPVLNPATCCSLAPFLGVLPLQNGDITSLYLGGYLQGGVKTLISSPTQSSRGSSAKMSVFGPDPLKYIF